MRRKSAGFSLMEVVIAMSIMAIALFGMISVISFSSRNNTVARERMLAMRAAEKQIETMKAMADAGSLNTIYNTYVNNNKFHVYYDSDTASLSTTPALSIKMNTPTPPPAGGIFFRDPVKVGATYARDANGLLVPNPGLIEAESGAFMGRYDNSTGVAVPVNIDMDQDGNPNNTADVSASANLGALPVKVIVSWVGVAGPGEVTISYVFSK